MVKKLIRNNSKVFHFRKIYIIRILIIEFSFVSLIYYNKIENNNTSSKLIKVGLKE